MIDFETITKKDIIKKCIIMVFVRIFIVFICDFDLFGIKACFKNLKQIKNSLN